MDNFIKLITEALEKTPGSVDPQDKFRDYEEWDSLAVLSIIALVKKNYGITIPRKEFDMLNTVDDLYQHILASC